MTANEQQTKYTSSKHDVAITNLGISEIKRLLMVFKPFAAHLYLTRNTLFTILYNMYMITTQNKPMKWSQLLTQFLATLKHDQNKTHLSVSNRQDQRMLWRRI
jgi:hypothetical protein